MPADRAQTPPQIAARLAVSAGKVLAWIDSGKLRAINLGSGARPRWHVLPEDLAAFLEGRAATPAPVKGKRRKAKSEPKVIEFY